MKILLKFREGKSESDFMGIKGLNMPMFTLLKIDNRFYLFDELTNSRSMPISDDKDFESLSDLLCKTRDISNLDYIFVYYKTVNMKIKYKPETYDEQFYKKLYRRKYYLEKLI